MDPTCRECSSICKRLDREDLPRRYSFNSLTPGQIVLLIEKLINRQKGGNYLKPIACVRGQGFQLALSLQASYPDEKFNADDKLVIVMQAEAGEHCESSIFFRFNVPPRYCARHEIIVELNEFVSRLVQFLNISDRLLSEFQRR